MLHYDFEKSIGYWVFLTAHAMERSMNEELASMGITLRQWQVLAYLALKGEMAQSELAALMGIEAPTLTGILDRMERDRWITRHGCPTDRRRKLIRPAPEVAPVWSRMVACAKSVREQAVQGLSDEQIEQLKQILAVMQNNLRPHEALARR